MGPNKAPAVKTRAIHLWQMPNLKDRSGITETPSPPILRIGGQHGTHDSPIKKTSDSYLRGETESIHLKMKGVTVFVQRTRVSRTIRNSVLTFRTCNMRVFDYGSADSSSQMPTHF